MSSEENQYYNEAGKFLSGESGGKPAQDMENLQAIWDAAGHFTYKEARNNDAAWQSFKNQLAEAQPAAPLKTSWIRRHSWAIAAGLGLLIMGGTGVWLAKSQWGTEQVAAINISTGNNEFKTVDLSDGSVVKLGANSSIRVAEGFGDANRSIILTGQAGFEVAKNPGLPFQVKAGNTLTTVLGTGFVIAAYPGENINIYVRHGKVAFGSGHQKLLLGKGNGGEFQLKSGQLLLTENATEFLPWENGEWVFKRTPLSEIAVLMKHRFGRELKFSDDDAGRQFTGKFQSTATAEEIVKTIGEALQIELTLK